MAVPRRQRITKRVVDAASPGEERYTVWDADLKGFGLRVAPSGVKTFIARYRAGGGRKGVLRQQVIGRHGVLTAEQARDRAKNALADAIRGADPQSAKAAARAEPTVAELLDLYLEEGVATKSRAPSRSIASASETISSPYWAVSRSRKSHAPTWSEHS